MSGCDDCESEGRPVKGSDGQIPTKRFTKEETKIGRIKMKDHGILGEKQNKIQS